MRNRSILFSLLLLLGGVVPSVAQTQIILLGTGTPYPDPHASGPATAVIVGKRVFLFDAGAGVMRQANAAGLPLTGPEATFITHLHSDHTLGYPDLILTSWVMQRRKPLDVYGPVGLRRMTDHLLAAFSEDIEVRTRGLEREVPQWLHVRVHEIQAGVIFDRDGVGDGDPCATWKLEERVCIPCRYARSLDPDFGTRRPALIAAAKDIDTLVHEVYLSTNLKPEDRTVVAIVAAVICVSFTL